MAKIAIKSEKLTPFGGIFSIMEQFGSSEYGVTHNNILFLKYIIILYEVGETVCHRI